jgi:hypothetical protein
MTGYVRIIGLADGRPHLSDGQWLVAYDPYAFNGRGEIRTTADRSEATVWDLKAFHALYKTAVGTRPDGKPNRPLTAFHLSVERTP